MGKILVFGQLHQHPPRIADRSYTFLFQYVVSIRSWVKAENFFAQIWAAKCIHGRNLAGT